jgi:hypothetical protein
MHLKSLSHKVVIVTTQLGQRKAVTPQLELHHSPGVYARIRVYAGIGGHAEQ